MQQVEDKPTARSMSCIFTCFAQLVTVRPAYAPTAACQRQDSTQPCSPYRTLGTGPPQRGGR